LLSLEFKLLVPMGAAAMEVGMIAVLANNSLFLASREILVSEHRHFGLYAF